MEFLGSYGGVVDGGDEDDVAWFVEGVAGYVDDLYGFSGFEVGWVFSGCPYFGDEGSLFQYGGCRYFGSFGYRFFPQRYVGVL